MLCAMDNQHQVEMEVGMSGSGVNERLCQVMPGKVIWRIGIKRELCQEGGDR